MQSIRKNNLENPGIENGVLLNNKLDTKLNRLTHLISTYMSIAIALEWLWMDQQSPILPLSNTLLELIEKSTFYTSYDH